MKNFFKIKLMKRALALTILWSASSLTQAQTVSVWLTKGDQSVKLQQQSNLTMGSNGSATNEITINESTTYQSMAGFGFALTQGSAEALRNLNSSTRTSLLNELFNTSSGNAISIIRISIGASDLSNSDYTYNQTTGDVNMNNFSLAGPDLTHLIPVIKEIQAINPNIKVLATPWTAPTWMKSNGGWIGGNLQTQYYAAYAKYFVKYLDAMAAQGINIWAVTPQNEPENPFNEPSMSMNSTEQKNFINNNLGPAIASSGHATKIIAFDHNCDNTAYPIDVLNNSSYVDGAAFHLYAGDISALSTVHNQTGKNVYFTEQYTGSPGNFSGDFGWHMQNIVIGSMRNWSKSVIEWNLAANPDLGPRTPGGCTTCLPAITVNNSSSFTRNVSYYMISQASKFIQPGAVRLESNTSTSVSNVVFKNPDGGKVLLAYNSTASAQSTKVNYGGLSFVYSIPASSAVTFIWSGTSTPVTIPSAPSNLAASAQSASAINLTWNDNSNNESNFELQRSANGTSGWTTIATIGANSTSYANTGLNAVTAYYYRIRSTNSAGASAYSNTANATTQQVPSIDAFSTIQAENYTSMSGIQTETTSDTGGGQNVGWTDTDDYIAFTNVNFGSGAASVEARVATSATFNGTIEFRLGSATGTLAGTLTVENTGGWQSWQTKTTSISGASGAKNLYLVFKGGNGITNINWIKFSASAGSVPTSPSSLSASATSTSVISLSWNDNSNNETGFTVQRSANGSSGWTNLVTLGANTTSYSNTALAASTTYYFRVLASNSFGSSGYSNTTSATTQSVSTGGIVSGGIYKIINRASGKVLDVSDVSTSNGARIHQWDWANGNNQKWVVTSLGGGLYKITAVHSGKALDVVDVSTANNAEIQQWDYNGGANQKWTIPSLTGGYYQIVASHSNKSLEVPGSSTSNGTKIVQNTTNTQNNQQWTFELQGMSARLGAEDQTVVEKSIINSIYPNPVVDGRFTVDLNLDQQNTRMNVVDLMGKVVMTATLNGGTNEILLPQYLNKGLYVVNVYVGNGTFNKRLVIK